MIRRSTTSGLEAGAECAATPVRREAGAESWTARFRPNRRGRVPRYGQHHAPAGVSAAGRRPSTGRLPSSMLLAAPSGTDACVACRSNGRYEGEKEGKPVRGTEFRRGCFREGLQGADALTPLPGRALAFDVFANNRRAVPPNFVAWLPGAFLIEKQAPRVCAFPGAESAARPDPV